METPWFLGVPIKRGLSIHGHSVGSPMVVIKKNYNNSMEHHNVLNLEVQVFL